MLLPVLVNLPLATDSQTVRSAFIILLTLLASWQGAFFCQAQSLVATVNGEVLDKDTQARLEGALVSFTSSDKKSNAAISGPDGRFAIVAARLEADVALAHRYLRNALNTDA